MPPTFILVIIAGLVTIALIYERVIESLPMESAELGNCVYQL